MAVEEGPVDAGAPGDAADGDLVTAGGRFAKCGRARTRWRR